VLAFMENWHMALCPRARFTRRKRLAPRVTFLCDRVRVSCPRSSSHFATNGGDRQVTKNEEKMSRFRPHSNATDFGIGTLEDRSCSGDKRGRKQAVAESFEELQMAR
jgi:hypothetical protein